jgi:hypothetical protein
MGWEMEGEEGRGLRQARKKPGSQTIHQGIFDPGIFITVWPDSSCTVTILQPSLSLSLSVLSPAMPAQAHFLVSTIQLLPVVLSSFFLVYSIGHRPLSRGRTSCFCRFVIYVFVCMKRRTRERERDRERRVYCLLSCCCCVA